MVVDYPSGAVGSSLSFFTTMPRIIFRCSGSVVPNVLPQVFISVGLACIAVWVGNPLHDTSKTEGLMTPVAFLLAFLLVFKTTASHGEYEGAMEIVAEMQTASRVLARAACAAYMFYVHENQLLEQQGQAKNTRVSWTQEIEIKKITRKVLRLIMLYWVVLVEYFQRTGQNRTKVDDVKKKLRDAVKALAEGEELDKLYPNGEDDHHSNPTVVLFWMKIATSRLAHISTSTDYTLTLTNGTLGKLDECYSKMEDIDKNQFPFPYCQLIKLLLIFYVFGLPFVLEPSCGHMTPLVCAVVAVGFYGLDELAEILDSPFGTDPNDIDLGEETADLAQDLDLMWDHMDSNFLVDMLTLEESHLMCFEDRIAGQCASTRSQVKLDLTRSHSHTSSNGFNASSHGFRLSTRAITSAWGAEKT